MPSDKKFLYHLIISQLYNDGFVTHANLLEQAALNSTRTVIPSDRLQQMLSMCAKTVREVDSFIDSFSSSFGEKESEVQPITDFSLEKVTQRSKLSSVKRSSSNGSNRTKQLRTSPKIVFSSVSSMSTTASETPIQLPEEYGSPPQSLFSTSFGGVPVGGIPVTEAPGGGGGPVDAMTVLQKMFQRQQEGITSGNVPPAVSAGPGAGTGENNNNPGKEPGLTVPITTGVLSVAGAFAPVTSEQKIAKSPNSKGVDFPTSRSAFSPTVKLRQESPMDVGADGMTGEPTPPLPSELDMPIEEDEVPASVEVDGPVERPGDAEEEESGRLVEVTPPEVKEEPDKGEMMPRSPDEILNQLDSLTPTDFGAIQNFADSLSMIGTLQDSNLAGSLASSLNLSSLGNPGVTGSPIVSHLGGIVSGKSGKLLGRLEDNSPSMLNMVCGGGGGGGAGGGGVGGVGGASATLKSLGVATTGTGGRRFCCPHCNKCYASYDCLSRHKRIHTGANKKTCPKCYRLFFRADHFKTHLSTCTRKNGPRKPDEYSDGLGSKIIWANSMSGTDFCHYGPNREAQYRATL